jgi:hypothetical protein
MVERFVEAGVAGLYVPALHDTISRYLCLLHCLLASTRATRSTLASILTRTLNTQTHNLSIDIRPQSTQDPLPTQRSCF